MERLPSATPSILIVDDKAANLYALEQILRDVPARIIKASSGNEALGLALWNDFALAILDVQMPGMDGYELAELLLGNPSTSGLPIIFASAAFQDDEHRFKGYASGGVDYLVKPLDPVALVGKVNVFLELARARNELQGLLRERSLALAAKAEELDRRNAFRQMLSGVSRELMRAVSYADARQAVERALGKVAGFIHARHAFVRFLAGADPDEGGEQEPLAWSPQDAPAAETSFSPALLLMEPFQQGAGIAVRSLDGLPEAAAGDRERLRRLGVRALLLLPIIDDEDLLGVVGFDWRDEAGTVGSDFPDLLGLLPDMVHGSLKRARAESGRIESQMQHRILFETMAQGVVYQDAAGKVLSANLAAERILGVSHRDLFRRDAPEAGWRALREDGSDFPAAEHPALLALKSGQGVHGVRMGVFNPREGRHRWVMIDAVPLFLPGERKPFQVYTTYSDFTDLRDALAEKERLAHVDAESRAKSRFLASMSHEIRTPMNAVIGFTQLLLREPGLGPRQREYLETIDRSGDHLLTLINNILDMARIEAGAERLDESVADFADVLTDVEGMFRLRAAENGISFRVLRPRAIPRRLRMDAGKVRQVLINLLGNAMKFTRAGTIVLRASVIPAGSPRARIRLEVEDTGMGIPADQLEGIFEPFVQAAPGAAKIGTGLGLAVSRRFARLMGGDISVESRLGSGSTFRFEFEAEPADEEVVRSADLRATGLAEGSPAVTVLVVEDDEDNRRMLVRMLDAVGLPVREAADRREALEAFAEEPCGIVLTDMRLPDGDGLGVLRGVRGLPGGAAVPVVVVSASTLLQEREEILAAGADAFIGKPVRQALLFQEIARLTPARFRYEGDGEGDRAREEAGAPRGGALPSAALLPAERRAALLEALLGGYLDRIEAEVLAIERDAPKGIAARIRKMADGFEYAALIELLDGERGGE